MLEFERKARRTVFKDESHGGDGLAADEHDGIVSGRLRECLGLAVGVKGEAASLVQQFLIVQRDAAPATHQLLEQCCPVDVAGNAAVRHKEEQAVAAAKRQKL